MEKKPCAKCPKGFGVTVCSGCCQSLCMKHFVEHRQELAAQMDHLGQEHDSLCRNVAEHEENEQHPLLLQINQWEEESIKKIQTAAETARINLRKLLDQMKIDVKSSLKKTTNELQTHQKSDDYTEADLRRWSTELTDLRTLLEAAPTIHIVEDQEPLKIIKVLTKTSSQLLETPSPPLPQFYRSTREVFAESTRFITLSDDGLLATFTGNTNSYGTIFGKNTYSTGVHHIHFRVENKGADNFFFGIVTSSKTIEADVYNKLTANGWWGFDVLVLNGTNQSPHGKEILRTGDMLKLTLDCQKKRILFENCRVQITLQTLIDIEKCPLPWKIAITLSRPNDALRILH